MSSNDNSFKELVKLDAVNLFNKELGKLLGTVSKNEDSRIKAELLNFEENFKRFLDISSEQIQWDKIQKLPNHSLIDYNKLVKTNLDHETIREYLNKLVIVKLNGGLGTSMGCQGPKSTITVRDELTFLDLIIRQIENINVQYNAYVPLVLMNSFYTDEETNKVINKYNHFKLKIYTFNQSRHPRIDKETLLPVAKTAGENSDLECWYPPGHGDFYQSFYNSGLLKQFISEGKEYVFLSNSDNLGAVVDLNLLSFIFDFDSNRPEFLMELTDKTKADVKGGTLVNYENKLRLLEIAQVPNDKIDEFKSVSKFKVFNTNNLWINLKAIERVIEDASLHMEIIVNQKSTERFTNVIQLETACGAAIKSFKSALGINVPRSRFLPVKTTSDLLLIMSNLFTVRKGMVMMNPLRSFPSVPIVKLGHKFTKVNEFLKRFENIPDCVELDHLTVSGDVSFGKGVVLRGTVIIIANHNERIDIPSGSVLDNKIVSGNLRILDH